MDISQKQYLRIHKFRWDAWLESFKNIEFREVGFSLVQVGEILSAPAEGLALCMFDATSIYGTLFQHIFVLGSKILAHNSNHSHPGEVAGGQRKISGLTAQHIFHAARWSGDGIECDGTDGKNAHAFFAFKYLSRMNFNFCRVVAGIFLGSVRMA